MPGSPARPEVMRHFHRTHLTPADVMASADRYFPTLQLRTSATALRARTFTGPLGTMTLTVRAEVARRSWGSGKRARGLGALLLGAERIERLLRDPAFARTLPLSATALASTQAPASFSKGCASVSTSS